MLVHRGATVAPHSLRVALPIALAANAPKVESSAFFLNSPLVSSDGGFMGKFPEAAEGAEVADVGLISGIQVANSNDAAAAGFDDDGGASTPESPQQSVATDLNSTQLDVSIGGSNAQAQIKEAIIKVVVQEKISDLLIRNGFSEDSARAIEAAAKTIYNVQSLPPSSIAVAVGALDTSGVYRATQISIYENKEYVGAIALAESGGYGEGAQPTLPSGLLDEGSKEMQLGLHYNLADGVYSAGVRNNVPEPVIREAIQLLGRLTDLKAPLPPEENIRALYARDFRGKSKLSGKVIYVGLTGPGGPIDCYSFLSPDGSFHCFDREDRRRRDIHERWRHFRADQRRAGDFDVRHALPSHSAYLASSRRHRLWSADRVVGQSCGGWEGRNRRAGVRIWQSHSNPAQGI